MRRISPTRLVFGLVLVTLLANSCQSGPTEQPTRSSDTGSAPASTQEMPVGVRVTPRADVRYQWAPHVAIDAPHRGSIVDVASLPTAPPGGTPVKPPAYSTPRTIIPLEEIVRLRAEALRARPNPNIQVLGQRPSAQAPTPGGSFEAINFDNTPTTTPPDPELAVGPNHLIAVVNTAFEIYSKTGTTLGGPTQLNTFFLGTPGFPSGSFDPNVLYDEAADRFIIGTDANGTDYCVAASTSSNPTTTWNRYCFATDVGGAFFDYPHIGVGEEAIFLGSNQFTTGFLEGRVWAMNKANMYSGVALGTIPSESTGSIDATPWPADLHGFDQGTWPTGTNNHYIMTEVFDGCIHNVWTWDDPFGTGSFTKGADLDLCVATGVTATFPIDWPNTGGNWPLSANDWRGQSTFYRNGMLWMSNQAISCNPGGGTVDCVRWAQIDPMTDTILDAGVFASSGDYRTFASIAANHCDDMAVGYSKGATGVFPATWVTGRLSTDPPGLVGAETVLKAGEEAYHCFDDPPQSTGQRWGDYTGMTIDPDGETFWYLGEYSRSNTNPGCDWGTYIGSFSFASCDASDGIFSDGFESGDTTAWSNSVP